MEKKILEGKKIWISGASRGIGLAVARALAGEGADLILSARSAASLETALAEIPKAIALPLDFSEQNNSEELAEKIAAIGQIDVLINNAGVARFKPMTAFTADDYNLCFNVNVFGPFSLIKAALPVMIERKSGAIINVNSVAAIKAFPYNTIYSATKAAFLAMSRSLREEVRKHGIKVVDILPGATYTEIWSPENLEKLGERMMKPEDVAGVVANAVKSTLNGRLHVEEVVLRPQLGDF